MKSFFVIIIGLFFSWHFMDITSDSVLSGKLAPIIFFIFLISLSIWIALKLHSRGLGQSDGSSIHDGSGFGSFGDD